MTRKGLCTKMALEQKPEKGRDSIKQTAENTYPRPREEQVRRLLGRSGPRTLKTDGQTANQCCAVDCKGMGRQRVKAGLGGREETVYHGLCQVLIILVLQGLEF